MALLRTARSVGALEMGEEGNGVSSGNTHEVSDMEAASNGKGEESLIMPYIYAALRHRDENVRLEALSLVCHTQKTSQPVSHFETVCLQNFLKWNMNIDSAPFRQGVLKCVAALLVRLRGATASYCKNQNTKRGRPTVKKCANEPNLVHNRSQKCGVLEVNCSTVLISSAELVLWLVREAHRSMAPDANYQRRILALQLYKEVLMALLPSYTTLPHHGKRVTSSSHPLLQHLNTMTAKKSVCDNGGVVGELPVAPPAHSYSGNKNITGLSHNCHIRNAKSHLPEESSHQNTRRDRAPIDHAPDSLVLPTAINSAGDVKGSASRPPLQGSSSNSSTTPSSLPPTNTLPSTYYCKNTLDGKDKVRNPSLHSVSPELDIYGDRKALDQPLLDLAYPWTLHTLLHLCIDEMNDVRAEAREIIHIFTSQGRMALSCSEGKEWMRHALKLCDSPKASDAESGGTLALTVALLIPEDHMNKVLDGVSGMGSEVRLYFISVL